MMSDPTPPPAANTPHPVAEVRSLAIVVPPHTAPDAVMEALWGNVNFNLTATALQRRLDRMETYKRERAKTFGAAARAAVKAMKLHATGDPYQRFLEAQTRLRAEMKAEAPEYDKADIKLVLDYGSASSRLYNAAEDAAKAKKDESERINDKIAKVAGALRKHLRMGPGGHDVEEEALQAPLPGMDAEVAKPVDAWMDEETRQVTYDTLHSELRVIDRDLAAATAAQDAAKIRKSEAARQQYSELLETLRSASLLDGLTPDDEDETVVAEVVAGDDEPDLDLEEGDAEAGDPPFKLQPDGPPEGLEDPTKHPALQPAIAQQKEKRAKKQGKKASAKKVSRQRKPKA